MQVESFSQEASRADGTADSHADADPYPESHAYAYADSGGFPDSRAHAASYASETAKQATSTAACTHHSGSNSDPDAGTACS